MKHGLARALIATAFLTAACRSDAAVARSGQPVMGTVLTVTVVAADRELAQQLADAAIEEARRWEDALTIWQPEGELARFNAKAGSGDVEVSPRLGAGLASMLDFSRRTEGIFDPAVGAIRDRVAVEPARPVTPCRPIKPVADALRVSAGRASLAEGVALDPGAIGKGLALDAMVVLLSKGGASAAFLDFGGSSQTGVGAPPGDERGWPVLVTGWAEGKSHGVLWLRDASLSTSRAGASDTTPVLDPRIGKPVPPPRLATVIAPSATAADVWSTALVVLGRDGLLEARADGVEALVDDERGSVRTRGFVTQKKRAE
jgi:thiamine biosynthesis lipoprotein